jgi:hypothetical protein
MTIKHESACSDEDSLIIGDLGSLTPTIAQFPHLIFRTSSIALRLALQIVRATGGIWGTELKFGLDGNEYDVQDWPIVRDFHLWSIRKNQEFLFSSGWGLISLLDFTMVIDAKSEPDLLMAIGDKSSFFGKDPIFNWASDFNDLALWISRLGWAYVPLKNGEWNHALFVTRNGDEHLCDALRAQLEASGYNSAKLRSGNGRYHWDGSLVL